MCLMLFLGLVFIGVQRGKACTQGGQPINSSQVGNKKAAGSLPQTPAPSPEKGSPAAASPIPTTSKDASPSSDFVIGPDDVLAVNVWREPEVSQTVAVRPDGKISLPLVGEVVASGLTPKQLEAMISYKLGNYMSLPEVTVIVHEVKSQRVVVAGQVAKPGSYVLQTSMTVLDAIAQAGGPLDYAKVKSIYVLRTGADGRPVRIKFNYNDVIHGRNLTQNIRLEPHDTVVVP
jgi:polysaccharide biosynthesis/export protein